MKKFLMLIISMVFVISIPLKAQTDTLKYLELNEEQLADLGFVINEKGIFFKTLIPESDRKRAMDLVRLYFNTPDDQGTKSILYTGKSYDHEKKLKNLDTPAYSDSLPALEVDYYFTKIIEVGGELICNVEPRGIETIPVLVRQQQYDYSIKNDVIVYLKLTDGLRQKLSYVEDLDKYIVTIPPAK